jgi:hypothetical protein
MKHLFCVLILGASLIIITTSTRAQSVTNNWYGVGTVYLPNSSNNYMVEVILNEKNSKVTGVFNYYFRDSLFSNKIEGTFYKATNRLTLGKQNIIFHRSNDTKIGVDCPMYGEFTLRNSRVETELKGVLYADINHQYTCPDINFVLKKGIDIVPIKKEAYTILPKKNKEAIVILPRKPSVINTSKSDTAVVTKKAPETINPKQLLYFNRQKVYTQELDIQSSSIRVELYDNGQIDYDSVSLYLNDKLVLGSTVLTHNAITITLPLNDSLEFNELSMFADNLGLIPPNTAALILYDGKVRHEIMMMSDLNRNATIKLKRKKKP